MPVAEGETRGCNWPPQSNPCHISGEREVAVLPAPGADDTAVHMHEIGPVILTDTAGPA